VLNAFKLLKPAEGMYLRTAEKYSLPDITIATYSYRRFSEEDKKTVTPTQKIPLL
jgi:hypothetical protein